MKFGELKTLDDAGRWHLIFMLLSMDKTVPFWKEMGLELEQSDALRNILQSFVREYRRIEGNDISVADQQLAKYQVLFQTTFEQISQELGEEVASTIYDWGNRIFQYGSEVDALAFIWRRLLRRFAEVNNLAYPYVQPSLPDQKLERLKGKVKKYLDNPAELENRVKVVEDEPMSPWDDWLYKTYSTGSSPLDWVVNTIEFVNTKSLWQEIEALLSGPELENLRDWAKKQAEVMEMTTESVELLQFK